MADYASWIRGETFFNSSYEKLSRMDDATFEHKMKEYVYKPYGVDSFAEMRHTQMCSIPEAVIRSVVARRGFELHDDEFAYPVFMAVSAACLDNTVVFNDYVMVCLKIDEHSDEHKCDDIERLLNKFHLEMYYNQLQRLVEAWYTQPSPYAL